MKKYKNHIYILTLIILTVFCFSEFLFTSKTILDVGMGDTFIQYYAFHEYFRELLFSDLSIPFYSFEAGIGQNFIAPFSYYMTGDFFFYITLLTPFLSMANSLLFTTILKVIIAGTGFYLFLDNKKFSYLTSFMFGLIFAFAGWFFFYSVQAMSITSIYPWIGFILLGMDKLIDEDKPLIYFVSLFLAAATNYLYFFMVAITTVFYFITKHILENRKNILQDFKRYIIFSALSCFAAGVIIFPTLFSIMASSRESSFDLSMITEYLRFDFKDYMYIVKYSKIALSPILLFILPLSLINLKRNIKPLVGIGIIYLLISNKFMYYFTMLFLHHNNRWPFLLIPLILLFLAIIFENTLKTKLSLRHSVLLAFILFIAYRLQFHYNGINVEFISVVPNILKSFFMYFVVLLFVLGLTFKEKGFKFLMVLSLVLSIMYLNAYPYSRQFNDTTFVDDDYALKYQNDSLSDSISFIKEQDLGFYRINTDIKNLQYRGNEPLIYNYRGLTSYNSMLDNNYINVVDKYSLDSKKNYGVEVLTYHNNPLTLPFFGVKYHISDNNFIPTGYHLIKKFGELSVYQNDNVIRLGSLFDQTISKDDFENLSELNKQIILSKAIVSEQTNFDYKSYLQTVYNVEGSYSLFYTATLPIKCEPYNVYVTTSEREFEAKKGHTCDHPLYNYQKSGFVLYLGDNLEEYILTEPKVEFINSGVYKINTDVIASNFESLNKNSLEDIITDSNKISAKINASKQSTVVLSIPYDKGWKIKIDGKVVNYYSVNYGLVGFDVSEGNHKLEMKYTSPGFTTGLLTSLISIFIFILIRKKYFK